METTHIQAVREQMTVLLATRFGLEEASLSPGTTLDELELDSLALVEFSLILKEHFGVPVDEDEISGEDTFDDVVMQMASKVTPQDTVG